MRQIATTLTLLAVASLTAAVKADDAHKRSPELQVLDRFVGTWDIQVTVKPAGEAETTYNAISTRSWSQRGTFIHFDDPNFERPNEPEFQMLLTYDPQARNYPGVMMMGASRSQITGTWKEETKTMSFKATLPDGNKLTSTHRFVDEDHADPSGVITNSEGKVLLELSWKQTRRQEAATSAAKSRGTIGFSVLTKENPFFAIIGDAMKAAAGKHGYDLVCVSAELDAATQAGQIDAFIAQKVAAIVLNPCDSESIGPAIKRANDAGIPVFTNDTKYTGKLGEVVCHVATDNYQGGKLAGKAIVDAIGESGGKVAILHFPPAESCQLRVQGFNEVLEEHNAKANSKKIEVAATLDGGGSRRHGFRAATDAIQAHPNLRGIFAINDPSALGAYDALENAGKVDQVTIIGFDGTELGKRAILEGKILCDPVQSPDHIGRVTVESIVKHVAGEDVDAKILIPTKLFYKTDAEQDPALKKKAEE